MHTATLMIFKKHPAATINISLLGCKTSGLYNKTSCSKLVWLFYGTKISIFYLKIEGKKRRRLRNWNPSVVKFMCWSVGHQISATSVKNIKVITVFQFDSHVQNIIFWTGNERCSFIFYRSRSKMIPKPFFVCRGLHSAIVSTFVSRPSYPGFDYQHSQKFWDKKKIIVAEVN